MIPMKINFIDASLVRLIYVLYVNLLMKKNIILLIMIKKTLFAICIMRDIAHIVKIAKKIFV